MVFVSSDVADVEYHERLSEPSPVEKTQKLKYSNSCVFVSSYSVVSLTEGSALCHASDPIKTSGRFSVSIATSASVIGSSTFSGEGILSEATQTVSLGGASVSIGFEEKKENYYCWDCGI